jgi:hypothetical protein
MDNNQPFHVKLFNDKIKLMNQANSKVLTLTQQEARSLHAEIYDLMATIAQLSKSPADTVVATAVSMDGGGFK